MRLIDTATGEFHSIDNPTSVKYSILSHRWEDAEQTFQDVLQIQDKVKSERDQNPDLPFDEVLRRLSSKIRNACERARVDGFEYLWIDTCCIDKTNSSELSESINSMYDWYAHSAVCYAFLSDVHHTGDSTDQMGGFAKSAWFTRGWTLQELIAPKIVFFYDANWNKIGTKRELVFALEGITGIDSNVLLDPSELKSVSVARRMSWASMRVTTKKEDEAYSLMGIFNVTMPTIYGEGEKAFFRLQQEILVSIQDQSIFVWDMTEWEYENVDSDLARCSTLLAPSSKSFAHSASVVCSNGQTHATSGRELTFGLLIPRPTYVVTAYGIQARLPYYKGFAKGTEEDHSTERRLIPLDCSDKASGQQLGIILRGPFEAPGIWPTGFGRSDITTHASSSVAIHHSSSTTPLSRDAPRNFRRGIVRFAPPITKYTTPFFMRFPRVGTFFIAHRASQIRYNDSSSEYQAPVDYSGQHTDLPWMARVIYFAAHFMFMWCAPFTSPFFPPLRVHLVSGPPPPEQSEERTVWSRAWSRVWGVISSLQPLLMPSISLLFAQLLPYWVFLEVLYHVFPNLNTLYGNPAPFRDFVFAVLRIALLWNAWRLFYIFNLLGPIGIMFADALLLPGQGKSLNTRPRFLALCFFFIITIDILIFHFKTITS